MQEIIKNLKDLRNGIFKDTTAVNNLIDKTILLAEQESNRLEKLVSQKFTEEKAIKIFRWLLGYTDFPPRKDGEGAYWWRSNLRVLLNSIGITKEVLEDSKFSG